MNKILASLAMIAVISSTAVGATQAYFSDTETSTGNTLAAGTLDLKVNDADSPVVVLSYSDMKPGDSTGYQVYCMKNTGSVTGTASVEFSAIINNENGANTPENIAETDPSIGFAEGELGQYLKRGFGWGPCNWSVPSIVLSDWQTGPAHPWGIPALNGVGGQTFTYSTPLNTNQEIGFFFKLDLENDLRRWDGTKWIDIDDNVIQSDSVVFDMSFHLDQTP